MRGRKKKRRRRRGGGRWAGDIKGTGIRMTSGCLGITMDARRYWRNTIFVDELVLPYYV